MSQVIKEDPHNTIWAARAAALLNVLRMVWPRASDAERLERGTLPALRRAEKKSGMPKKAFAALSKYLDELPGYRDGSLLRATEMHGFLMMTECNHMHKTAKANKAKFCWKREWVRKARIERSCDRLPRGMN